MLYNWYRDYNPALGRYVQSDPIGLAGGSMSTFAYVDGKPLTLIDALGLKLPRNSAHCVALREKMARKNDKLDERYREYDEDKGNLPERVCSTEKLSESRRGHRTLINMEDSSLRKLEQRYADECDDGPPSPPALAAGAPGSNSYPEPPGIEAAAAAAGIATAIVVAPEVTVPALGAAAAGH